MIQVTHHTALQVFSLIDSYMDYTTWINKVIYLLPHCCFLGTVNINSVVCGELAWGKTKEIYIHILMWMNRYGSTQFIQKLYSYETLHLRDNLHKSTKVMWVWVTVKQGSIGQCSINTTIWVPSCTKLHMFYTSKHVKRLLLASPVHIASHGAVGRLVTVCLMPSSFGTHQGPSMGYTIKSLI